VKKKKPKIQPAPLRSGQAGSSQAREILYLLLLLAGTFLIYLPALQGQFVNWDDPLYVTDSPWIRLSPENVKALFFSSPGKVNLPVTRLSLSLNHAISGFEPWSYHLANILLHLLNTFLVYVLVRRLWEALNSAKAVEAALIGAAFFGLHPLHVESVAWVAERKDVLYTAFFLGSLICYLQYVRQSRGVLFFWSLLLFFLSLLSKAQAVTLPLVLVAVDWLLHRKTSPGRWLLEKGPFFAAALVYGLWNLLLTKGFQAGNPDYVDPAVAFSLWDRLVLSGYAFSHYLLKIIVPLKLSVIYPYPEAAGGALSPLYWLYLLPILGCIGLAGYLARKCRTAAFALLFFLINILITLQPLTGITPSIMNDRHTYLASLGIFLLLALLALEALKRWVGFRRGIHVIIFVYLALLAGASFQRSKVWQDSLSLWNDVLSQYDRLAIAWINRGEARAALRDFAGAGRDFNRALELDPKSSLAWANRGAVKIRKGDFQGALPDLEQALSLNAANGDAYVNRGMVRATVGDLPGALADFDRAVALLPGSVNAWTNRGFAKIILGDLEGALADCNRALSLAPEHGKALWGRGAAQIRLGKRAEGCLDSEKAWKLGVNAAKLEWDKSCSGNNP
jgi:tetratricopeptide (TPR) repeat protein